MTNCNNLFCIQLEGEKHIQTFVEIDVSILNNDMEACQTALGKVMNSVTSHLISVSSHNQ